MDPASGSSGTNTYGGVTASIDSAIVDGSGVAGLVKLGNGDLYLTGTNTYGGGTEIKGGKLWVEADANLGAAGTGVSLDGGVLAVQGTSYTSTGRTISLGGNNGGIEVKDPLHSFTAAAETRAKAGWSSSATAGWC
nr:autotransporter-associated beta strand repeat-containing protein [Ancylobacter koreensis]